MEDVSAAVVVEHRTRAWIIAAIATAVAALGLVWLVAVPLGPEVCSLVYPAPENCFIDSRAVDGAIFSGVILVVAVLTVALGLRHSRFSQQVVIVGFIVLAITLVLVYPIVAYTGLADMYFNAPF